MYSFFKEYVQNIGKNHNYFDSRRYANPKPSYVIRTTPEVIQCSNSANSSFTNLSISNLYENVHLMEKIPWEAITANPGLENDRLVNKSKEKSCKKEKLYTKEEPINLQLNNEPDCEESDEEPVIEIDDESDEELDERPRSVPGLTPGAYINQYYNSIVNSDSNPIPNSTSGTEPPVLSDQESQYAKFWHLIGKLHWTDKDEGVKHSKFSVSQYLTKPEIQYIKNNIQTYLKDLLVAFSELDLFKDLTNTQKLDVLAHIIGKGKEFYMGVIETPELALYLLDDKQYQPLMTFLTQL